MFHLEGITPNSFKKTVIINPENPKESISFSGKGFSGSSFRARDEQGQICTYKELNEFINRHMTQDERIRLYNIYSDIDAYFADGMQERRQTSSVVNSFEAGLSRHITRLVNLVKFRDVKDFLLDLYKQGRIVLPSDVTDSHPDDHKLQQKHIDCTYLKTDYLDAIAMVLYMRFMLPIWGKYLPLTRVSSNYNLKEYHALKMISGTPLFKERTFSRLDTYIRGITEIEDDISVFVSGLSNEEIPFLLMAQVVVKRFPIFSLSYVEGERNTHLMSMMYHLIGDGGKAGNLGKLLKNMVFEKKPVVTEWSDEDNSSVLDMYKSRETIPAGDLVVTEVFLTDFYHGDNPDLTDRCHEYIKGIDLTRITPIQIRLMTWVISTMIPGNAVPLFEGSVLRRTLAIVQSQLYTWGFKELAILLTAESVPFEKGTYSGNIEHRVITKELEAALDKVYGIDRSVNDKAVSVGYKAIQDMSSEFYTTDWYVNCAKELYAHDEDLKLDPIFTTHVNIRNMLAELLVKLSTFGINN